MVHILRYGLPLCGFNKDLPKNWPTGHQWVHEDFAESATCRLCKDKLLREPKKEVR